MSFSQKWREGFSIFVVGYAVVVSKKQAEEVAWILMFLHSYKTFENQTKFITFTVQKKKKTTAKA